MRSAMQQRDSLSVVIKFNQEVNFTLAANQGSIGDAYNIYKVLQQSPMYSAFATMYDQVKLDGAKVLIHQTYSNVTLQGVNNPLNIVTAWDRSGLSASAAAPNATAQNVTFDAIAQYSSAIVKPAMYGSFYTATRAIYPTTLQEKAQWISTNALSMTSGNANADYLAQDIPTSLIESGSYKFKPIFIISMRTLNAPTEGPAPLARFSFEWSIPVTFRGLRKLT